MKPSKYRAMLNVWITASVVGSVVQAKYMLAVPPRPEGWVLLIAFAGSVVSSVALRVYAARAG